MLAVAREGSLLLLLLPAQEPDSEVKARPWQAVKVGSGWVGIDDAVDDVGIAAAGDVVEAAANCQVVAEEVKAFFELQVQGEIAGKTLRAGRADELLLVGEKVEGESGAGFQGIGEFELVDDRQLEERKDTPGEEAVGSVPGIRARLLRAENGIVDIEVESLIGAGAWSACRSP